jgi:hypothetical protein
VSLKRPGGASRRPTTVGFEKRPCNATVGGDLRLDLGERGANVGSGRAPGPRRRGALRLRQRLLRRPQIRTRPVLIVPSL